MPPTTKGLALTVLVAASFGVNVSVSVAEQAVALGLVPVVAYVSPVSVGPSTQVICKPAGGVTFAVLTTVVCANN